MILATHAIVGAALAELFPGHPVAGFAAAFASHYLLDAVPHWEYALRSYQKNENDPLASDMLLGREFLFDLTRIAGDILIGLAVVGLAAGRLFAISPLAAFAGAVGAILPDAFQFFYFRLRCEPFRFFQKLHLLCHSKDETLKSKPFLGLFLQALLAFGALAVVRVLGG